MKTSLTALFCLLLLVLAACSPVQEELPPMDPQMPPVDQEIWTLTPSGQNLPEPTPEVSDMSTNAPPVEKFVSLAVQDLASRLNMDPASIQVVKTEEVTWPDSALGCPEPGKVYTKGTVPGYRILLEADGNQYSYHTDWNGQVILCPVPALDGDASHPTNTGPTPQIGVPIK
jgi:hypothetical protein